MSLVTNLIAILLILLGFINFPLNHYFQSIGVFAFSGAITNWLAVHMLFERVPLLYGSGVIVNRFEDFKVAIKDLMMTQFFTRDNLQQFLQSNSAVDSKVLDQLIDHDLFFQKMVEAVMESPLGGMLAMFGGAGALDSMKPQFNHKIDEVIAEISHSPKFSQMFIDSGSDQSVAAKIELIVDRRLNELTPVMVKEIIQQMIKKHLGWLVVWGGFFGGLIGLLAQFIKGL